MPFFAKRHRGDVAPDCACRGHFARASSRRSGDPRDVLHAQETPRARSGGHRVRRRTAARGASSASARGCIQRLDFFPLLHRAPPRGVPTSPTRLSISARFPGVLTRVFPPLHHTTHAQRGRGAGVRRAPRVPRQPRGGRGGDAEPGMAAAEGTSAVEGTVAEARNSRSPSPSRPSPVSKTPPDTPESRARRRGARDERRRVFYDARSHLERRPPRDDVTEPRRRRTTHRPVRRGVRVVAAPVAKSDRRDANGEDARRGGERAAAAAPAASTRDDAASYASPGFVSRDGTRTEGERYSESDKTLVARYDAMQTDFERETRGFAMAEVDETKRWFHFEDPPGVGVWPSAVHAARPAEGLHAAGGAVPGGRARGGRRGRGVRARDGETARPVRRRLLHRPAQRLPRPRCFSCRCRRTRWRTRPGARRRRRRRTRGRAVPNKNETNSLNVSLARRRFGASAGGSSPRSKTSARRRPPREPPRFQNDEDFLKTPRVVTLTVPPAALVKSGALLLLFRDPNGDLARFRDELRTAFPSAPTKQPTIAHCTLLRAFRNERRVDELELRARSGGRQGAVRAVDGAAAGNARARRPRVARARGEILEHRRCARAFKMGPEV